MIKPKKHSAGDYFNNLVEARDTYIQYLIEQYPDLDDELFNDYVNDLNLKLFENSDFKEKFLVAEDLEKYKSLHTAEYDTEIDGSLPERAYQGVIVVLIDSRNNLKNLILDGNHRKNTLLKLCPKQKVLVFEVLGHLPE